jgi:hypothetical protein
VSIHNTSPFFATSTDGFLDSIPSSTILTISRPTISSGSLQKAWLVQDRVWPGASCQPNYPKMCMKVTKSSRMLKGKKVEASIDVFGESPGHRY